MLKSVFGADTDQLVQRVLPFLARVRIHPDTLTLSGVALSAGAAYAFATGHWVAAGFLMGFAGLCDLSDGVVARAQGSSTPGGAFLDSTMDRVSDLLVLGGITYGFAAVADLGGVALALWATAASVMTSYTRARAERHLSRFGMGVMERAERCVVLILGAFTGWLVLALWIVAIGATATSVQRLVAARRLLEELARTGVDPTLESGASANGEAASGESEPARAAGRES